MPLIQMTEGHVVVLIDTHQALTPSQSTSHAGSQLLERRIFNITLKEALPLKICVVNGIKITVGEFKNTHGEGGGAERVTVTRLKQE